MCYLGLWSYSVIFENLWKIANSEMEQSNMT